MEQKQLVLAEKNGAVGVARLNRPEALNALSPEMLHALCAALEAFDVDPQIRVIVITGEGRAFAAGADIRVLAQATPAEMMESGTQRSWQRLRSVGKPLIAAVNGYAYGGGCELALACDMIVASESARFAQPEIKLGIMPGAGGTQRLARALGVYRAMEMILTGEPISAGEAYRCGLVNRVVPAERCLEEALALATVIAERPPIAVRLAREALRLGAETSLRDGMEIERRNYLLLYDTTDQKEGMAAFLEKRPPRFSGR